MSEDKLQASIARAARAEALLGNELLQEAFVKLAFVPERAAAGAAP